MEFIELSGFKTKGLKNSDWNRFIKEGLIYNSENSNVKYNFDKMSKLFGLSYLYWLEGQYKMIELGGLNLENVAKLNGNVPIAFFNKFK